MVKILNQPCHFPPLIYSLALLVCIPSSSFQFPFIASRKMAHTWSGTVHSNAPQTCAWASQGDIVSACLASRQDSEHQQRIMELKELLRRLPEPRSDDPDVSQTLRRISRGLLDRLQMLLSTKKGLAPSIHSQTENSIVSIQVELDLIYWRLFPINDLPSEILTNIFRLLSWSAVKPNVVVKYRLWLTWVCRHWRSVAISDVNLWDEISFQDFPPYGRAFAWLERAGTAPLDLRNNERDESWGHHKDDDKITGRDVYAPGLLKKLPQ